MINLPVRKSELNQVGERNEKKKVDEDKKIIIIIIVKKICQLRK